MSPRRLRVTIDATTIAYERRTGIGRHLESLLPHFARLANGEAEFVLLAGRPIRNPVALELVRDQGARLVEGSMASLYLWQQTALWRHLRRERPDVHFTPDGLIPPLTRCPTVGILFDLIWKRVPGSAAPHIRLLFATRQKASVSSLTVALTGSEFTRHDAIAAYGSAMERLRVVPCGIDTTLFRPRTNEDATAERALRERLGLGDEPYLLAVGNMMPHKNLGVTLRAIGRLAEQGRPVPQLLFVGTGNGEAVLASAPANAPRDRLRFAGFLPDEELCLAYRCAQAVVFPSRYEGFGLPILEGMASGVPVVHSAATSLPEVAGDAGVPFQPDDDAALADAITRLMADAAWRADRAAAGLARARTFTWERCADATWGAMLEAASGPNRSH